MSNDDQNSFALLEQIKSLKLSYNQKVTPRRRLTIEKPQDAFHMLMKNRNEGKRLLCSIILIGHEPICRA